MNEHELILNNIYKLTVTYIKGIVHPKILILSSFIYPHVVPNLYDFLSSVEHKDDLKNVGNPTVSVAVVFNSIFVHIIEVNGNQNCFVINIYFLNS